MSENPLNARKSAANKHNTPTPTPGPVAEYFEALDAKNAASTAQPPAKLSKLAAAMQIVDRNVTEIQALGLEIDTLHTKWAPNTVWDLETKEGAAECDLARKESRAVRLKIQNLRDQGKSLLNSLKGELVEAAEGDIARAQAIEDNAKGQQEAKAKKEQERVERHEKNIAAISLMAEGAATMTSAEIAARIDALTAIIVDDSYEEFESKARRKHREVADVLAEASFVAAAREKAQHEAEERAEEQRKELADLKAKEDERLRIKGLIDQIKNLPAQVEGTELANVREALRIHKANEPTAEVFGDQLELAELTHFKVTKQLEELEYMLGMAQDAPTDVVVPLDPQPQGGGEPIDDAYETTLLIPATTNPLPTVGGRMTMAAVDQAADPFSAPAPTSAPAPRPRLSPRPIAGVSLMPQPTIAEALGLSAEEQSEMVAAAASAQARTVYGTSAPGALTAAGQAAVDAMASTDPREGFDITESEFPDLLKAAQNLLRAYNALPQEAKQALFPHQFFGDAITDLSRAVDFTNEFSD